MDYNEFDEVEVRKPKRSKSKRKFNKKLNVDYLSVNEDDASFRANIIRTIASGVSYLVTPRQVISILFILAAYTIMFLVSNIISDIVFIYHECFNNLSKEVMAKLGDIHDAKIRAFGICFAIVAIMVELDLAFIDKNLKIFKAFIPRSLLLLFVATLSEPNPIIAYEWNQSKGGYNDDNYGNYDGGRYLSTTIRDELPVLAIRLQAFSSTLL